MRDRRASAVAKQRWPAARALAVPPPLGLLVLSKGRRPGRDPAGIEALEKSPARLDETADTLAPGMPIEAWLYEMRLGRKNSVTRR
jgi:hypothetical protein